MEDSRMWRNALPALGLAWICSCSSAHPRDYGNRPEWDLTLSGGKNLSAKDFDQKVLIVDFWASWCPPCLKEVPGFIELQKKYQHRGLVILGFSFDRTPEAHDACVRDRGLNYVSVYSQTEEGKQVVAEFEKSIGPITVLPTTLVIDRTGVIVFKHVGYGSTEDFEKVITPLIGP
jgi:thiol-disulfide isomerase/thioredoxin